jgi:hypothetical protein
MEGVSPIRYRETIILLLTQNSVPSFKLNFFTGD